MCFAINRDTNVTFELLNRTKSIPLANIIDEGELREQLDHIRSLSLSRGESTWLRGNMFYGKRSMFQSDFMEWFENLNYQNITLRQLVINFILHLKDYGQK